MRLRNPEGERETGDMTFNRRITLGPILLLLLAAGLAVHAAAPAAPALRVEARLADPGKSPTLGDPVSLTVTLRYPEGAPAPALVRQFPDRAAFLDEKTLTSERRGGEVAETRRVRLAFFETGAVDGGPLAYTARWQGKELRGEAPPVRVTVKALRTEKEKDPDKAEPPWVLPFPTAKLVLIIAGILAAAAALGALLWWWLGRRRRAREAPAIPAHLEARDRLQALAGRDLPRQGRVRELYFESSEIIRDYLGKELGVLVLERTTAEILAQLPEQPGLSADSATLVTEFLADADRVKFAKHMPTTAEVDACLRRAFGIVDRVHADIEAHRAAPPAEPPAPAAEEVAL
jgi:hypothetical protein